MLLKALLMITAAFFIPRADTTDEPEGEAKAGVYVVKTCGDGEPVQTKVVICGNSDPEDEEGVIIKTAVTCAAPGIEAGGPWLGIQFGPVPKPLARHLNLDDDLCLMVLNVVEGSPADEAGLQQYDVIASIKGEDVPADVGEFLNVVRGFEPGDTPVFSVIRGAEPVQVTVTVGTRPDGPAASNFKYDLCVEELSKDNVFHHGGFLCKDADGNWSMKGLDNLKMLPKLKCFMHPEEGGDGERKLDLLLDCLPGHGLDLILEKGQQGESLKIERENDRITVTRTTTNEDGTKTTTTETYDGEDAVKEGDPDAYEHLQTGCGKYSFMGPEGSHIVLRSLGDAGKLLEDLDIQIDIDEALDNAQKAHDQAADTHEKVFKKLGSKLKKHREGLNPHEFLVHRKASISFEVESDGKIRVATRNGDEELVQAFNNVAELEALRPDLFKKYQKLQATSKTAKPKE
ncbi:MAG: PDZ domain-containing protein [Planctomycetota bacterium]